MSLNNFTVIRQDGKSYDMWDCGIIVTRFEPQSPSPIHHRESVDGRDGVIDLGTTYDSKRIDADFTMIAEDILDYPLLQSEIFKLFDSKQYFYIIPDNEQGKRYKVKCDSTYSLDRIANAGQFSITFTSDLAYSESVGTTLTPQVFDVEEWQVGQGLIADDLEYVHKTNQFKIYNAGDVAINPRQSFLEIIYTGASNGLSITNQSTGDTWQYNGSTSANDRILLNGVRSFKNGASIFGDTNRKLINLAVGWNDFVIAGTTGAFEIKFDFRYLYL